MKDQINDEGGLPQQRIAVIGTGISGLSAAWLLADRHMVTLYEKEHRLGGHSNTVDAPGPEGAIPVDTGFIVYNEKTYPNLVALFDHLKVPTLETDMSFAASIDAGAFEYSGTDLMGLFADKRNLVRPRMWRMLRNIMRFYREAPELLTTPGAETITLGEYLAANRYGEGFLRDHLLPMGAAIWSTPPDEMRQYPAVAFVRFCANHGLLQVADRPKWRTVEGGSREYVKRMIGIDNLTVRSGAGVATLQRGGPAGSVSVIDRDGHRETFDSVVIATHADEALAMLDDPSADERAVLSAFRYQKNRAILHSDAALMPQNKKVWASWNYLSRPEESGSDAVAVSYWMNRLQHLDRRTPLFVTLNPRLEPDPRQTIKEFDYTHPLFDLAAIRAQKQLWKLQGRRNTYFAGAYFGHGFHEDGLQAGLAAAEQAGCLRRPWQVAEESGRIHLGPVLGAAQ